MRAQQAVDMNNASHNDTDNISAVASITPQRITQELIDEGRAVPGGIFATEAGVAWLIGCSVRTLRRWRENETGPQWVMTTRYLYPIDELAQWLQSRAATQFAAQERPNAAS